MSLKYTIFCLYIYIFSQVCEQLLDACMEENPDREGHDGNGMDNETAIIVRLKQDSVMPQPAKKLKSS